MILSLAPTPPANAFVPETELGTEQGANLLEQMVMLVRKKRKELGRNPRVRGSEENSDQEMNMLTQETGEGNLGTEEEGGEE